MPLNVQVSRHIDAIRKKLGVQGHAGLNLVDDCLPTWDMSYADAPEDLALREEQRFGYTVTWAALAANYNRIFLTNNSARHLVVIEKLLVLTNDAAWGRSSATGTVGLTNIYNHDMRSLVAPVTRATSDQNAAQGLANVIGYAPAGMMQEPKVVLPQNGTFAVASLVVNVAQSFWIQWREFMPTDEEMRG